MSDDHAISVAIIRLMKGVVYAESEEAAWLTLQRSPGAVIDHFRTIGVDVVIDEAEQYAYLKSGEAEEVLPRLVRRRPLSHLVSVLLVLLREQLAEFETNAGAGRLVLDTDQLVDMLRLYLPDSTDEARLVDKAESTLRKAEELGFVRRLPGTPARWEVRRILKAYVDAQALAGYQATLAQYAAHSGAGSGEPVAATHGDASGAADR